MLHGMAFDTAAGVMEPDLGVAHYSTWWGCTRTHLIFCEIYTYIQCLALRQTRIKSILQEILKRRASWAVQEGYVGIESRLSKVRGSGLNDMVVK
jgi:hypothetical protein